MIRNKNLDDTHLCIRCNQVIEGLTNYINHRRANCASEGTSSKQIDNESFEKSFEESSGDEEGDDEEEDEDEEDSSDPGTDDEMDFEENFPDDFDVEENPSHDVSHTSEDQHKSHENDHDDFGASIFFQCLELQSSANRGIMSTPTPKQKKVLTRKATAALINSHGDSWIDESPADKLMTGGKKHDFYYPNEYPDPDDEESDEDYSNAPPRNHTKGKWKPESQVDRPSTSSRPPHNYTGGKWKPESAPVRSSLKWHREEESSNEPLDKSLEHEDRNSPPPSHTKGKWIPGTKITKLEYKEEKISEKMAMERDHFWCSACNRKLASRAIYEQHLKSNLHIKRTQKQNELEEAAEVLPTRNIKEISEDLKQHLSSTLEIKSEIEIEKEKVIVIKSPDKPKKKFRTRTKTYCKLCNLRLSAPMFGKHLISHFHYRKMLQNPSNSFDIVLNNFHKIIIQSPFQCQPCRFYFNTQEMFLKHWHSKEHVDNTSKINGKFLCSFCKFECLENEEMAEHLIGVEHQQVISVINRSKPIIIKIIRPIGCSNCNQEFRYNIQLIQHLKYCNTVDPIVDTKEPSTFLFTQGSKYVCSICKKIFQSGMSLQKHELKVHQISVFFCSYCQMTFKTKEEAKAHRSTSHHKILSSRKRLLSGAQDYSRAALKKKFCPVCKEERMDLLDLKHHIRDSHPEHRHHCSFCGQSFIFSQEVACHVRDKKCQFYNLNKSVENVESTTSKTTATITSTTSTSSSFVGNTEDTLIAADSINLASTTVTIVDATTDAGATVANSNNIYISQGLDMSLLDNNFPYILSESTIMAPTTPLTNETTFFTANSTDDDIMSALQNQDNTAEIKFKCKLCSFSTHSHAEFLFHEILHDVPPEQKSNEKINCPYCKKDFRKQSLRDHLRQHTNERIFQCDVCPMAFTRKANLKAHKIKIHKDPASTSDEPLFICTVCGKKFRSKHILEQHQHVHRHQIKSKTFSCLIENCVYVGRDTSDMESHLLTHSGEETFHCDYQDCDYEGQNVEQLRSHWKKHEELEKKYACQQCDYKTSVHGHYKRHLLTHTKERPFKCPYCSYTSNNTENLRKHVISTTLHKGRFMYECEYCDRNDIFKTNVTRDYSLHLSQVHKKLK